MLFLHSKTETIDEKNSREESEGAKESGEEE